MLTLARLMERMEDVENVRSCLQALTQLSLPAGTGNVLALSGAEEALAASLTKHSADGHVVEAACELLIAAANDESSCLALNNAAVLAGLVAAFRSRSAAGVDSTEVPPSALASLLHVLVLSSEREEAVRCLARSDVLPSVAAALKLLRDAAAPTGHALLLLECLTATRLPSSAVDMAGTGLHAAVAGALSAHVGNESIAQRAASLLERLAESAPASDGRQLAAALAASLRTHEASVDLTRSTMAALKAVATCSQPAARALVEDGHAFALVAAFRRHEGDASIAAEGCLLTALLATDVAFHTRLAVAGAMQAVLAAVRRHEDNEHVVSSGCEALTFLVHGVQPTTCCWSRKIVPVCSCPCSAGTCTAARARQCSRRAVLHASSASATPVGS